VRAFLAARSVPGVERVDGRGYARTLATQGGHAVVCVRPLEPENALELRVSGAPPSDLFQIATTARRCFDLSADPARITLALKDDPLLGPLLRRHPGLRIPGVWDAFECAVRTLLDQGVSPSAGRTLAARVVTRAGRPIPGGDRLTRLFPSAVELADADLGGLDIAASRLAALRSLAQAVADGAVDLSGPADQAAAALEAVPGIGSWTAQYVALRALGEPDAFPAGDLVLRRMAGVRGRPSSASVLEARAEAWRPWRGYAAFHLWCAASEGASPATRISNGEDSAQTTLRPVGPSREPGPAGAGASAARRRS
jgi:AraC family transcriptional regulator of adaptative response / DNA-3-methyladenine glycosylase II